jgi:hypothetical protein
LRTDALAGFTQGSLALAFLLVLFARIKFRRLASRLVMAIPVAAWLVLTGGGIWGLGTAMAAVPPQATSPGNPCTSTAPVKSFNVSLINIPLFVNRFADVVPEGRMYILDENIATARATFTKAADPFHPADIIEPLTLRVNRGDCVSVHFTNRLNEPAPPFNRDASIFPLPGEILRPPGTITPNPREFAPALTQPDNDFNPAAAPRASMHFDGLDYDVKGSDGTAVGNNPNSTVVAGGAIDYKLLADQEGEFQFKDGGDFTSHETRAGNFIGSHAFGAFGAFVVEPPGTTFFDPVTGLALKSGTRATIKDPNGKDFREHVLFMHDEVEAEPGILTRFCIPPESPAPPAGSECINPTAAQLARLQAGTLPALGGGDADVLINGEIPAKVEWFAFNYRSEPGFNREEVGCPALNATFMAAACVGEETSLSSWPFGDPGAGDLVFHNYAGEPVKIHLLQPAEKETHTFHWHVHRWPFDPKDEGGLAGITNPAHDTAVTNPLDVQAVTAGSHYELIPEGGAGSPHDNLPAGPGDIIFHCHLYPHFADGMWGLTRIHDVLENGTRLNPDTTPIQRLIPLDDFPAPPAPTAQKPGFPFFVPGVFGFKGPKPPLGVASRQPTGVFPPTQLEKDAAQAGAQVPGGFFRNPCPAGRPTKTFNVAAIQLRQVYNPKLNWNNPQSRVYVLQADKAAVLAGLKKPEPFSPLLNVGDCVVYNLTNELPQNFGGTVFDRAQITNEVSIHQHMVLFDVLTSDGAANGWNYDEGADSFGTDRTITYRDFVQADTSTNSFHDHFFPNVHQDNGLFGGGTIHPPGCTFHDPRTGALVTVGTIVDVRCAATTDYKGRATDGKDYRGVAFFVEDHVPMFQPPNPNDPNDDQFVTPFGVPIFPAKFPSSHDDQGAMGVNYRLEPFEARRTNDPSKLFDSKTWGDPFTPLPRAFAGDNVKIRIFQLSQEESHGFNLDRWRWNFEPNETAGHSNIVQAQHIGMLEYFNIKIATDKEQLNPSALELRDYLYNYGGADDWFLGAWGIFRVAGCNPNNLDIYKLLGLPPLQPLPDNNVAACVIPTDPAQLQQLITRQPGNPCPRDATTGAITVPVKRFSVAAFNKDIRYNSNGVHDPNGVMYSLAADEAAIKAGTKAAVPLVIRVNAGDCVEVTLSNHLDAAKQVPTCFEAIEPGQLGFEDPSVGGLTLPGCLDEPPDNEVNVPGFRPFPVSQRVSLRPTLVNYHEGSAGSNVGFNHNSTIPIGGSILYRWYAPDQAGLAHIQDRADVQTHLHRGLYAGMVIEPAGSTYLNPSDGTALTSGEQAVVNAGRDFREGVVFMNSDLSLFQSNGLPVPDNKDLSLAPSEVEDDAEDQGEFSIGYRNEPWVHRFLVNPDLSLIFSSIVHGDPDTPLFRAYSGDFVRLRVAQAVGDPRSTGFALHDHRWRRSPNDPQSQIAATQGQFNPVQTYNIHLDPAVFGGAGGPHGFAGDYLYRSTTEFRHLTGGQWGIFRVFNTLQTGLIALPDHPVA